MSHITLQLNKLDAVLKEPNPVHYACLYPPLPVKERDSKLGELGIDEGNLNFLFAWKNGFSPRENPGVRCMIFYFRSFLLSLDAMKEHKIALDELSLWDGWFIPLLADMTGNYILFNNKPGKNFGKLHLFSASLLYVDKPISFYDSIPAMIETTIVSYEQGVFTYEPTVDRLYEDIGRFTEIARKINVNSEYWGLR